MKVAETKKMCAVLQERACLYGSFCCVYPGSRWPEDHSSVFLAWADLNSLHIQLGCEMFLIIFWALGLTLDVLRGEKS